MTSSRPCLKNASRDENFNTTLQALARSIVDRAGHGTVVAGPAFLGDLLAAEARASHGANSHAKTAVMSDFW